MPAPIKEFLAGSQVPKVNHTVTAAGSQRSAIGRTREALDTVGNRAESTKAFPRGGVPQTDRGNGIGNDPSPIGREQDAVHLVLMRLKSQPHLSGSNIP